MDKEKRKKITDALGVKLDSFMNRNQFKHPVEPQDLPENYTFTQYMRFIDKKYEYFWQMENYEEANKLIDVFFKEVFELDFKFEKLSKDENVKNLFLKFLTTYAKHHFYGMMNYKRPKIFGVKSSHLEAYIMFQIAAEYGSAEAYFYLSLMQHFGLDNFKDKLIDFEAVKDQRINVSTYLK